MRFPVKRLLCAACDALAVSLPFGVAETGVLKTEGEREGKVREDAGPGEMPEV